jgi:hypothetical protein
MVAKLRQLVRLNKSQTGLFLHGGLLLHLFNNISKHQQPAKVDHS